MDKYRSFGLRENWLEGFLLEGKKWLMNNNLGPVQFEAFQKYMKDAELLDKKGNITPLATMLLKVYLEDRYAVWQIIWINLYFNSLLFNFYISKVPWRSRWTKRELVSKIMELGYAERTAKNAVNALTNTFDNSPLGEWFGKKIEKRTYLKQGIQNISYIAFKYALEKIGKDQEKFKEIFGISYENFYYHYYNIIQNEVKNET